MRIRLMTAAALATLTVLATAGAAAADQGPVGIATDSPGVLSGNVIQIPIDIPINLCGNSVNVVGLLNPASGNSCENH